MILARVATAAGTGEVPGPQARSAHRCNGAQKLPQCWYRYPYRWALWMNGVHRAPGRLGPIWRSFFFFVPMFLGWHKGRSKRSVLKLKKKLKTRAKMRQEASLPPIGQTAKRRPRRPAGLDLRFRFWLIVLHLIKT